MPYTLNAEHVVASDGYYEWYAQHQLKAEKVVYHVCPTRRKKCSEKLTKGDGRIFIHLMRWRMVNPLIMKELEYAKAAALQILKEWVGGFVKATPVAAADVAPPEGPKGLTGLDAALKEAATSAPPQAPPVEQGDKGLRGSRAVGAFLHERAEKRRKEEGQKKGDGSGRSKRSLPKGSPERGRSREKKKKRKKGSGEGSDTSSSRSSMDFHEPSTRGGVDLWRLSKENPGKLLKSGMKELSRYLADRTGDDGGEDLWTQHRVMAYINQIVLTQHPPQKIGVRNQRELVTLGTSLDLLMQGRLACLGDLLMQRLKALEMSLSEQSWQSARHQELIPPQAASLTPVSEREKAARAELKMAKLKELLDKGKNK